MKRIEADINGALEKIKNKDELNKDIDKLKKDISDYFSETKDFEINRIGNLVILDKDTNQSYKNACFYKKRAVIIDIERNDLQGQKEKIKYLPPGTKRALFKQYRDSAPIYFWTKEDAENLESDIADELVKLFT